MNFAQCWFRQERLGTHVEVLAMSDPFEALESGGRKVPLYLLQFDKHGEPTSIEARKELLRRVQVGEYRDVYVFAHGWNNDFDESLTLFRNYFRGFLALQPAQQAWKPVFVGVQWPSIALLFPWEKGVRIAGDDAEAAFQMRALAWIGDALEQQGLDPARLMTLTSKSALDEAEQKELAGLLRAAIRGGHSEMGGDAIPTQDELVTAAREFQKSSATTTTGEFGFATDTGPAGVQAAGFLSALDPRNLVRTATVYMMKDRAGVIGSQGVKPLLEALTQAGADIRLVGHSYGARVMLAALATAALTKKVRSALLLQPAVNQYCFAEAGRIPGVGGAGGFRPALDNVALPVYCTLSVKDFPLHDTFHLALRRGKDLGEAEIAAGAPPSKFCALGGYGPQGLGPGFSDVFQIVDSGGYAFGPAVRVVALDGTEDRINSHGDVTNSFTFWALAEQDRHPVPV